MKSAEIDAPLICSRCKWNLVTKTFNKRIELQQESRPSEYAFIWFEPKPLRNTVFRIPGYHLISSNNFGIWQTMLFGNDSQADITVHGTRTYQLSTNGSVECRATAAA
ncbi:hypothetical protein AO242_21785 [Pseudomonas sp. ICMP 561]|nr:hypothetical protein AO242_21785 [Pseudomonas sp. ICMP 561]